MFALVDHTRRMAMASTIGFAAVFVISAQAEPANTLQEMFSQLTQCLRAANSYSNPNFEVTIVFALRRDGSVFGKPRVSYIKFSGDEKDRAANLLAIVKGFDQCLPLSITDAMGGAIAGRPIAYRFGPKLPDRPT